MMCRIGHGPRIIYALTMYLKMMCQIGHSLCINLEKHALSFSQAILSQQTLLILSKLLLNAIP